MLIHLQLDLHDLSKIHPSSRQLIVDYLLDDHIILYIASASGVTGLQKMKRVHSLYKRICEHYRVRKCPLEEKSRSLACDLVLVSQAKKVPQEKEPMTPFGIESLSIQKLLTNSDNYSDNYKIEQLQPDSVWASQALALRRTTEPNNCLTVPAGADLDTLWKIFFQPYVDEARDITLCDRFALKRGGLDGLKYLLDKVKGTNVRNLTVYASPLSGNDATDSDPAFRQALSRLSEWLLVAEIKGELVIAKEKIFQVTKHARHIRFDDLVWDLDSGIEILGECPTWRAHELHRNGSYLQRIVSERALREKRHCLGIYSLPDPRLQGNPYQSRRHVTLPLPEKSQDIART